MGRRLAFPVLAGLYHAVQLGADRVEVCNASRSVVLTAPSNAARVVALLHALDGTVSVDELETSHPGIAVRALLDSLDARGLLIDAAATMDDENARDTRAVLTASGLQRATTARTSATPLAACTVLVAGCGPVAAAAAVALAKAGIVRMLLADDQLVSQRDVATCPVLTHDALGRLRSEALREACLRSEDVLATVVDPAETAASLSDATIVIIQARYEVSGMFAAAADAALEAGIDHIVHWQDALEVVIGPVIRSGGRPCHRCMESRRLSHVAHLDEHVAYLAHRAQTSPEPEAFLASHTSVAAGLLSTAVLQHLAGTADEGASRSATVLDLATSEWRREPVLEVPGCAACAAAAEVP